MLKFSKFLVATFVAISLVLSGAVFAQNQTPAPVVDNEWDWLKLTSNEWLKGDLVALYDDSLEFDSDNLGLLSIDWGDVAELYSKDSQSIRLTDDRILEGRLVYKDGQITIGGQAVDASMLISIASAADDEWGLWDGSISFGLDIKDGNTKQQDITTTAEIKRRSSSSRFQTNYLGSHSKSTDVTTGIETTTVNSDRVNSFFDLFISQRLFFRAADYEYFSDEFQNIHSRNTLGIALGYTLVDTSDITLEMALGPSYQITKFDVVAAGEEDEEDSYVVSFSTTFDWEIVSDVDYFFDYNVKKVSEEAGNYLHHLETGIEISVVNDLDVNFTYYVDRTDNPKADDTGLVPEQNDTRFVVSVSYDF
ncbi:DUF481 domain-containing protein [Thalassotalea agarivorans]|uniref:Putative salt-induced outer membrane protein YdiY n=1 Tax=Thalassotalea agarivorans TaxID=349064 RepID=A0A1I0AKE3_THASX|nr:DUF481 domain-containing protein [Thalassotalea agarivorans]SES94775.1 Putative salt-induced outer membrane protein YdiY [Thalassotalea agarivorans]